MFGRYSSKDNCDRIAFRQDFGAGANGGSAQRGLAFGLVSGSLVSTETGWRPVETIMTGQRVQTLDHGLQKVLSVDRGSNWTGRAPCPDHLKPLHVPAGTLGNKDALTLLPQQAAVVEIGKIIDLLGEPLALVRGANLQGFGGITPLADDAAFQVFQLQFHADEVIHAGRGALVMCPGGRVFDIERLLAETDSLDDYYSVLSAEQARTLISRLSFDEATPEKQRSEMAWSDV